MTENLGTARNADRLIGWRDNLRAPIIAAPMFLASTPALVIAQCTSGIMGTPLGLRLTKDGINAAMAESSLEGAMQAENRNQLLAGRSDDAREAQRAFLEKRKPVYTNS